MNPLQTAIAAIRRRPLLGVAAVGVGGVLVYASRNRAAPGDAAGTPAGSPVAGPSLATGSATSLPGYGSGPSFTGGDLSIADLASAAREGNALLVDQIARLIGAVNNPSSSQPAPNSACGPIPLFPQPPGTRRVCQNGAWRDVPITGTGGGVTPPPGPGPVTPPPTGTGVPPTRPPASVYLPPARVSAILAASGHANWRPPLYATVNETALRQWIARALANTASSGTQGGTIAYLVRPGDSLSGIASRFGTPGGWQTIYAANRNVIGTNPNLIRAGQRLNVLATRGV